MKFPEFRFATAAKRHQTASPSLYHVILWAIWDFLACLFVDVRYNGRKILFSRKNDIRGWIARQNSIQLLKRLVRCKRLVKIVFLESAKKENRSNSCMYVSENRNCFENTSGIESGCVIARLKSRVACLWQTDRVSLLLLEAAKAMFTKATSHSWCRSKNSLNSNFTILDWW